MNIDLYKLCEMSQNGELKKEFKMKTPREVLGQMMSNMLRSDIHQDPVDKALHDLSEIVMARQKPITQSYDDFDNGYETGYRSATTDIAKLFEEQTNKEVTNE